MSTSSYPDSWVPTLDAAEAAALLGRVIDRARVGGAGSIVVFDLDSTLLDNRPRQALILREYGALHRIDGLAEHHADHWQGWDARIAMARSGLAADVIEAHIGPFRSFWRERFFTSKYCVHDRAIAGAAEFVAAVLDTRARVFYVTGRHEEMRAGTVRCFQDIGFACPAEGRVELLMKPSLEEHDDAYKLRTYATLRDEGTVVAAFDNEPAHINGYRESFPDALAVHMATDHSMRDIPVAAGTPSIRDFTAFRADRG